MNKSKTHTRLLTVAALGNLTACAVLSGLFLRYDWQIVPGMPTLRLAAAPLFIYIAGFLFGPVAGGAAGLCSDLLTFAVKPTGVYLPTVTLCAVISGILPGLFRPLVRRRTGWAAVAGAITTLAVSMLNSAGFWMLRHLIWTNPPAEFFAVLFFPRLFTAAVLSAVYAALLPPILRLIYKNDTLRGLLTI